MKRVFISLDALCAMKILDLISHTQITPDSRNILHSPVVANTKFLILIHVPCVFYYFVK